MIKKVLSIAMTAMLMLSTVAFSALSASAAEGNASDGEYYTYYFYAPKEFFKSNDSIGIYYWSPAENASWPGVELTKEEHCVYEFENGDCIFEAEVWQENSDTADEAVTTPTIIFNAFVDGSVDPINAVQTVNISTEGFYDGVLSHIEYGDFKYGADETKYPRYTEDFATVDFNNMIYVPTEIIETETVFGDPISACESGMWYYYWGDGKYGVTETEPKPVESDSEAPVEPSDSDAPVAPSDSDIVIGITDSDTPAPSTDSETSKPSTPSDANNNNSNKNDGNTVATGDVAATAMLLTVAAAATAVVVVARKKIEE